jgi:drug/metabolite transporter (DMT)-like permease
MLVLVFGAAAIGFAPIFVRWSEVGLNATAFWRLALALPVLCWLQRFDKSGVGAASAATVGPEGPPTQDARWPLLAAGIGFALDLLFWHPSIALTSVANATLLANLTPLFVVAFAWVVQQQRPAPGFLPGTAVALLGAACLALTNLSSDNLAGDALGALTAVAYAGYLIAVARARVHTGAFRVSFVSTAVATVLVGIAALTTGETLVPTTLSGAGVLLGLALLVHVGGQGGIVWALGRLPATLSSVVILVQPVVATALGWWWLGEALGPLDFVGGLLVIGGILLCRRAQLSAGEAADVRRSR